ncbi:hypothetical protein V8Z80_08255 [Orrella sp. JC864]|uniref:hypothetical protein n=1 Tax=Orrella sp. JC864 TaxID=3120298 RepID=UPI0030083A25
MTVDTQKLRNALADSDSDWHLSEFSAAIQALLDEHSALIHDISEYVRISSQQAEEIERKDAEVARLREAVQRAYGYLWHVNNEPGTPNRHYPEAMAYEARKVLRDLLTTGQRGDGINAARAALSGARNG